jgi:hypothetical protein
MPDRGQIIYDAVLRSRRDWLRYTVKQEKAILSLFDEAAQLITARLMSAESMGKISAARLAGLLDYVTEQQRWLRRRIYGATKSGMAESVSLGLESGIRSMEAAGITHPRKIGLGTSFIDSAGVIHRWNAAVEVYAASSWYKIHTTAMDHLLKYRPSGQTLSGAVWDVARGAENVVRRRITQGVLLGDSASNVAKDIQAYLNEPNRLYRRVRGPDGVLRLSRAAQAYHPGAGVYRSSYKNAMRVVRTEMARAYREGQIRYGMAKPWIAGVIWRIGGANPCEVCIDLDGTFFPLDEVPSVPHPHCQCYMQNHIVGDDLPDGVTTDRPAAADRIPAA